MKSDSLRRRKSFREPNARFLIVCEGEVTEPAYFHDVRCSERGVIHLEIVPGGVPKSVVERAVEMKKESEREARSHKDDNLRYDHVWCVFDIDEHRLVPEAKQQAQANSISLAVSNPCFELWFLLHFQDQTAYIKCKKVQQLCRKHMPRYVKTPDCDALRPHQTDAIERATQLENRQAKRDGTDANPSTGVHRLIQEIQDACRLSAGRP